MIRAWIRKWLGLQKGKILLWRQNGKIVRAFIPRECQFDYRFLNEPGAVVLYSGEYGPIEIEDLPDRPIIYPDFKRQP
jgi:hypothetical protein